MMILLRTPTSTPPTPHNNYKDDNVDNDNNVANAGGNIDNDNDEDDSGIDSLL